MKEKNINGAPLDQKERVIIIGVIAVFVVLLFAVDQSKVLAPYEGTEMIDFLLPMLSFLLLITSVPGIIIEFRDKNGSNINRGLFALYISIGLLFSWEGVMGLLQILTFALIGLSLLFFMLHFLSSAKQS